MKRVVVVTGTRADYGIYIPVLEKLENNCNFHLELLVTGMHLSALHGMTVREIEKDGYRIGAKVNMLFQNDSGEAMGQSLGVAIIGMSQYFSESKPDFVIVLGDRGEMLAASIAASHQNIPIVHLHGGEVSGSIDESIRHSVTKFSHIHFPATKNAARRIEKMGEENWRIFEVGAPRIDTIVSSNLPTLEQINNNEIYLKEKEYYLLVYHPVTTEKNKVEQQIENIMQAMIKQEEKILVILPNSDAGNQEILDVYKRYEKSKQVQFVVNFNHKDYLAVLKNCKALIGNSSSGIIEAASFSVPVLNIGLRQQGRDRSSNVIDVLPNYDEILAGIKKINSYNFQSKISNVTNIYGNGTASQQIVDVLENLEINNKLITKMITY